MLGSGLPVKVTATLYGAFTLTVTLSLPFSVSVGGSVVSYTES